MSLERLQKLFVSLAAKEAAFRTDASVDTLLPVDNGFFATRQIAAVDNANQQTGYEGATDQRLTRQWVDLNFSLSQVRSSELAFVLAYAHGGVATTTPTGATNARRHKITKAASQDLPTFTAEAFVASGIQWLVDGCMIDGYTLRMDGHGDRLIQLQNVSVIGCAASTGSGSGTEGSEAILTGANSAIWLDEVSYAGAFADEQIDLSAADLGGSPAEMAADLVSFELQYSNNINRDGLWIPNSGNYPGRAKRGTPSYRLSAVLEFDDATHITRLEAQAAAAAQLKILGAEIETNFYDGFSLILPKMKYLSAPLGSDAGRHTVAIEANVLEVATYGQIQYDIINEITALAA